MVDLLIRNGLVVTVDGDRRVIDDGAVAVEGREIVAVGRTDEVSDHHDADRVIDADGMAVVPGFIDPHIHIDTLLIWRSATVGPTRTSCSTSSVRASRRCPSTINWSPRRCTASRRSSRA
jgi:cytosine/adenosine deaminase-related metal-dependent hydrolase